jgi:hypothetical protein
MPLTSEEMRLIRKALQKLDWSFTHVGNGSDNPERMSISKLLRCDFPHIPDATKKVLPSIPLLTPMSQDIDDGRLDVIVTSQNGGYLIECRRRAPYKFYPVEWFDNITFTEMMVEKLLNDEKFRREAIRDAKGAEFYMEKSKRKPRQPREKTELSGGLFDLNGNPIV